MKKRLILLSLLFAPLLAPSATQAQSLDAKCQAAVADLISATRDVASHYDQAFADIKRGVPYDKAIYDLYSTANQIFGRVDAYRFMCPEYIKFGYSEEFDNAMNYYNRKSRYLKELKEKYDQGN